MNKFLVLLVTSVVLLALGVIHVEGRAIFYYHIEEKDMKSYRKKEYKEWFIFWVIATISISLYVLIKN